MTFTDIYPAVLLITCEWSAQNFKHNLAKTPRHELANIRRGLPIVTVLIFATNAVYSAFIVFFLFWLKRVLTGT